ncbi:ORF53 [Duck adenovirus 2]|uniref:ORF53 n=1 Tax=Duck adenovirus 2 TaxID=1520006 RepID=A0A075FAQ3_9ADEN|nr:ORF53 [Duck adenovirus 2]AIE77238.1 ORF53 [Duck adenovirus 2]UIY90560.1 ORF53 [Duck adenovirus 2]
MAFRPIPLESVIVLVDEEEPDVVCLGDVPPPRPSTPIVIEDDEGEAPPPEEETRAGPSCDMEKEEPKQKEESESSSEEEELQVVPHSPRPSNVIGCISFHLPYIVSPFERSGLDIEKIEMFDLPMLLMRAVLNTVGDESEADNEEMNRLLDDMWVDSRVEFVGGADGYWGPSYENGVMMSCMLTISAPLCTTKHMAALLFISANMFRFGRVGQKEGRYISRRRGLRVHNASVMKHVIGTLFCVPNKKEN